MFKIYIYSTVHNMLCTVIVGNQLARSMIHHENMYVCMYVFIYLCMYELLYRYGINYLTES